MTVEEDAAEAEAGVVVPARVGLVEWGTALGCAAVVTAAGLAMFVGAAWAPLLAVLSFVWVLSAGQLTVDLYRRRRPLARMDGAVGARIGAATGVLVGAAKAAALAVTGMIERYGLHHGAQMDAEYAQGITSAQQLVVKLTGQPMPAEQARMMMSPQYHAAAVLTDVIVGWLLIVLVTTAAGAFVGYLQGKRRMAT